MPGIIACYRAFKLWHGDNDTVCVAMPFAMLIFPSPVFAAPVLSSCHAPPKQDHLVRSASTLHSLTSVTEYNSSMCKWEVHLYGT